MGHGLINQDRINNASSETVARVAVEALDAIQDRLPEYIALGAAAVLAIQCKRHGIEARRVYEIADRILNTPKDERHTDFATVKLFMEYEQK